MSCLKELNLGTGETSSSLGESTASLEDGHEQLSGSLCSGGDNDVSTTL